MNRRSYPPADGPPVGSVSREFQPKDDTGQAEIGSWYIRIGQREKGEALVAQSLQRSPDEVWTYVRVAEALLGVPDR